METEITLRVAFSTDDEKRDLISVADESGLAPAIQHLASGAPDSELADADLYRDSFESLVMTGQDGNSVELAATCGSEGWDFLLGLIEVLGPHSSGIDATFMHDEEPDEGEWPVRVEYREGSILVNGEPQNAGDSSSNIDLEGKHVSLAVMQNAFLVEDMADEMNIYGVHAQSEINDQTDYVVYFGPDSEELSDENDEALLEQAKKDGRKLITYSDLQDLLFEIAEKYA